MTRAERMGKLMFRHARKETSRKEELELSEWRKLSPEYEKVFQQSTDKGRISRDLARMLDSEERILEKIRTQNPAAAYPIRKKRPLVIRMMLNTARIAASVILVVVLFMLLNPGKKGSKEASFISPDGAKIALDDMHRGFLVQRAGIRFEWDEKGNIIYVAKNFTQANKDKSYKIYSGDGGHFRFKLPDSISIWLNENTTLQYPANFSLDSVKISVEGETYFECLTTNAKGLTLNAKRGMHSVVQLSTNNASFNFKAYADSAVQITVVKGTVVLQMDSAGVNLSAPFEIHAGQQAQLVDGKWTILQNVDVNKVIAWKNW